MATPPLIIEPFHFNDLETNYYLVINTDTQEGLLVDCGEASETLFDAIAAHHVTPRAVLLTHTHWDHADGLATFLAQYPVPVYSRDGKAGGAHGKAVAHGAQITVCGLTWEVLETSGHTADSISFSLAGRLVFTGDALFAGSIGGAEGENQQREIRLVREHVLALPEDVEVFPGHGPISTVGVERRANPFFQTP